MRISTTTLESFRLFMQPEQEWMSEDDLTASIVGSFVPNHKVLLGLAFGKVLENPVKYRAPGGYRITPRGGTETFELGDDVMGPAFALIAPGAIFEAKGMKRYGRHDVIAKADQMAGARIVETKATLGYFDFDKYAQSYQWRFMVDIFQPASVTYHIFCLDEGSNGVIALRGVETFTLYPYADVTRDCHQLVQDFEDYVTKKGLAALLDERQKALAN